MVSSRSAFQNPWARRCKVHLAYVRRSLELMPGLRQQWTAATWCRQTFTCVRANAPWVAAYCNGRGKARSPATVPCRPLGAQHLHVASIAIDQRFAVPRDIQGGDVADLAASTLVWVCNCSKLAFPRTLLERGTNAASRHHARGFP